jgi:hypothetical protein
MTERSPSRPGPIPASAASTTEIEALAAHFIEVMDALFDIVKQESELVRAGRLGQATQLAAGKAELSRLYLADATRLRANRDVLSRLAPARLDALKKRHDAFRSLLQTSLIVLATAHAVSEGIVRGVSSELARKAAPQTYGRSGRPTLPKPNSAPAIAVSRSL